ncbi:hypothetical protein L3X38_027740 [Prunus dulcis]|uniref:Uncharacterized protein n=1 Tax=Prunus dulcis TaxID=3755 RepID=A0AAD4Z1F5_PRUDU|nr:hypothetical protein L3X38_027740 [Prunus dulcis]
MFFSDTPEHVLQEETSSEGHSWLDLQGGVVLDNLIQREEPTKPTEPAELDTPAEPATPVEPAIFTDVTAVTEPITPYEVSLIVPDQAPLDNPKREAFWELTGFGVVRTPKLSEWEAGAIPGWVTTLGSCSVSSQKQNRAGLGPKRTISCYGRAGPGRDNLVSEPLCRGVQVCRRGRRIP